MIGLPLCRMGNTIMEVKGNSDFIWKASVFRNWRRNSSVVHWFMAPRFHCRAKILQTTRLPKKGLRLKNWGQQGKLLTTITHAGYGGTRSCYVHRCVPVQTYLHCFIWKLLPIERQKGVRRKRDKQELGHTVRTFKCFPTISGLVQQSVGETVTG